MGAVMVLRRPASPAFPLRTGVSDGARLAFRIGMICGRDDTPAPAAADLSPLFFRRGVEQGRKLRQPLVTWMPTHRLFTRRRPL
jgi:hypothetical protein